MACYSPLTAWLRKSGGKPVFKPEPFATETQLPCGQCVGCKIGKAKEWSIRCWNEASMHEENSYFTLTYNNDHLPKNHGLDHEHFQLFIRSLRKRTGKEMRFYMCGEYGKATEKNGWIARPHYHVILFGFGFPDKYKFYIDKRHHQIYRSPLLEKAWGKGHTEIGEVTTQSAAYVARYILKKQKYQKEDFQTVDTETGEIGLKKQEYTRMSNRRGIGYSWYQKYKQEIMHNDSIVVNGKEIQVPRYYRQIMKDEDPEIYQKLREIRIEKAKNNPDNVEHRLKTREYIQQRKINKLPRHEEDEPKY